MAKNAYNLSNKSSTFMGVLVVFMLLIQGGNARLYTCWGGCLNECFLLSSKQLGQRFPCYVNCMAKCFYAPGFGSPPATSSIPPPSTDQAPASSPSESILEADSEIYADSNSSLESDSEIYADFVGDTTSEIQESRINKRNNCLMQCSWQICGLYNNNKDETVLKKCLIECISKCKDLNV